MNEPAAVESLYERDLVAWCDEQAALLRAGRWADVDIPNLIEEVESLGNSQRSAVRSRLRVIMLHLLKLRYQPERESRSWRSTLIEQRAQIEDTLDTSPSLKHLIEPSLERQYAIARREAAAETGLPIATFPKECPFTGADVLGPPLETD